MNKAFTLLILAVLCIVLSDLHAQPANSSANSTNAGAATVNPTGQPLPTTQQLGQMLDQKDYAGVIKETQRIMHVKAAATTYDKADLDILRGEAQLGLKQQGTAAASFNLAAKEAADPTKAGLAKGMVNLLQQSKAFMYTPKASATDPTKQTTPIDIVDPASRKLALVALFNDEWTPAQAKIEQLKKQSSSLPPILQAAELVGEMRGLEIAGTGTDTQTSKALGDLNESAAKLMNDYLEKNDKRVDSIQVLATSPAGEGRYNTQQRGLSGTQITDLKDVIATTGKLSLAAKQVAAASGDKGQAFSQIADKSDALGKKASEVLNTDYNASVQINGNNTIQNGTQRPQNGNVYHH